MLVGFGLCGSIFEVAAQKADAFARSVEKNGSGERGVTMAVHSTLGFGGAIVGPLLFGAIVDAFGSDGALGWGLAYGHLGLIVLIGPLVLWWLRPKSLPGDRKPD